MRDENAYCFIIYYWLELRPQNSAPTEGFAFYTICLDGSCNLIEFVFQLAYFEILNLYAMMPIPLSRVDQLA